MVQIEWMKKSKKSVFLLFQSITQWKAGNGGNSNPELRYYTNEKPVWTAGLKMGFRLRSLEISMATNFISSDGRYLMPREWGRDPFFTFLPRERNEGSGDVWSWLMKAQYSQTKKSSLSIAAGYYRLPNPDNVALNKYGMPSYMQFLSDFRYKLDGFLKGWEVQFLYTTKVSVTNTDLPYKYVINRVNMHLLNCVINFYF
jgi:hypothetical protein